MFRDGVEIFYIPGLRLSRDPLPIARTDPFVLAELAKLEVGTFPQMLQRFENRDDFQLQCLAEASQLADFHFAAEIQARPADRAH
ncbi:MAG: hypothetical protein EXS30_11415 [Pedosphaera sp.]|nr:hypothetical protein [Pedosphaera sp.]